MAIGEYVAIRDHRRIHEGFGQLDCRYYEIGELISVQNQFILKSYYLPILLDIILGGPLRSILTWYLKLLMTSPTFFATTGTFGWARVLSRIRAANSSYNSDVLFRVRRKSARLSLYIRSFKVLEASYMLNQNLNCVKF